MEMVIKVLPEFRDVYKITLVVPNDVDAEEYVDEWIDLHAINVMDWEWN